MGRILILISVALFKLLPYSASIDRITPTNPLRDGDVLVSSGGTFAMGFFNPDGSSNRYVGIWYNRIPNRTVWVANRDNPFSNRSGVASILPSGDLAIHYEDEKVPLWSTNVSTAAAGTSNTLARINDFGNLVLFRSQNSGEILWQSFDHPSNTLLSFMKLGLNRRTGMNWFLTSWKSPEDPGTGKCTYKMSTEGLPQLFLSRGSEKVWRSGPWIGDKFAGVAVFGFRHVLNLTYIDNQDEVSMSSGLHNASFVSVMMLNESGSIERWVWKGQVHGWIRMWVANPDYCDKYGSCGPNSYCDQVISGISDLNCKCLPGFEPASPDLWSVRDGSEGCMRKKGSGGVCGNGEGFVKVERTKVADTSAARVDRDSDGYGGCEQLCLKNCSCSAYAIANVSGRGDGCITWYGNLMDIRLFSNGGIDMHIRVDAAEFAKYAERSKRFHWKWSAIIIGSLVAVLSIILLAYLYARKKHKGETQDSRILLNTRPDETETSIDLRYFDLRTIIAATNDFSLQNKLGEGGFGTVYKGHLDDGQEIAVKRLSKSSGQGILEFKNEVSLIARLQHKNLVKLLGCCIEQEEKILIYEYLPNKSLDSFIFDKEKRSMIKWGKRFEIVLGIVRGILYLHEDSRLKIIHRDLKSSNVLLDVDMNPKISDFGMARIFGEDQIQANTERVVGTYGYMSPEYAMEGLFSIKSDVFSFGVLLLEIISGRKNNTYYKENLTNLTGQVWKLWNEGKAIDVVDESLCELYDHRQVLRCIQVALLCLQESAIDRPTMSEVSFMLCHDIADLPRPNPPAFIIKKENYSVQYSSSTSVGVHSVNEVTITEIDAR